MREYFDIDGNPTTLFKLVRTEPDWAISRIKAMEADLQTSTELCGEAQMRVSELEAERDAAFNKVANVMLKHGLATGHADTLDSLLSELDAELAELREGES